MKIQISSPEDIEARKSELKQSAARTQERLLELATSKDAISLLANLKFSQVGADPLDSNRRLNLIEQLNQTFTCLASLKATKYLLEKHPSAKPFTLNLGTRRGTDIISEGGNIAAEVFSAVKPGNNKKLRNDCDKVSRDNKTAKHKYVFFMCPNYKGLQPNEDKFPNVKIVAVWEDNIGL